MVHLGKACIVVCLTMSYISLASLGGAATSPPQEDPRPLTDNETATLWSNDADTCVSESEYARHSGDERTLMEQLADCTDITFKEPPSTAARWTTYDFENLHGGPENTSIHPPHANLTDSVAIRDAHATIFGVHPSTRLYATPNETPLYIAPSGSVRGLVDYRVRTPSDQILDNPSIEWTVLDHEIQNVRLKIGDEVVATQRTQTPEVEYTTSEIGRTSLTLEADIQVVLNKRITPVQNQTGVRTEQVVDAVTVSQRIPVTVYDPLATVHYAEYPNGDDGIAISQRVAWNGFSLAETGNESVRGIWRYFTARDAGWDTLVHSTQDNQTEVESDASPVYVHAFPSKIGPQVDPVGSSPQILDVWGPEQESPAETIPENVSVGVVDETYTRADGLAVRHDKIDQSAIRVQGVVHGVNATLIEADEGAEREIRASNLTSKVLERNSTSTKVRIELRDAQTNKPIALSSPFESDPRFTPIGPRPREGYITIGDVRVETNASGIATVSIRDTGIYTARYHPGTWRSHTPAYIGDTATVAWHPLTTLSGWMTLTVDILRLSIPFVTALYAGLRLGTFLNIEEYP